MSETAGNGTPTWLKAAITLGVPAVIAGYLVWSLESRITRQQEETNHRLAGVSEALSLHTADTTYQLKQMERVTTVLRQICLNGTRTPADRERCLQ